MHEAERGLFDLRRGRPLYVTAPNGHAPHAGVLLATVESLSRQTLDQTPTARWRPGPPGPDPPPGPGHGFDQRRRAKHERGPERRNDVDQILRLSSAIGNYAANTLDLREASAAEIGGLTLARLGGLLPAVVSTPADPARVPELREHAGQRRRARRHDRADRSAGGRRASGADLRQRRIRFRSRTPRMPASCASARPTASSSTWRL